MESKIVGLISVNDTIVVLNEDGELWKEQTDGNGFYRIYPDGIKI